jgi:hypothetical protein
MGVGGFIMLRGRQGRGDMMVRRFVAIAFVAVLGALAGTAPTANADGVPNHNHFLTTPGHGNVVQVGPHVCDNPDVLHGAFHNFHENVHTGAPTAVGDLTISRTLCS